MLENTMDSVLNGLSIAVDYINGFLNITPGYGVYWVALVSLGLGYLMKERFLDAHEPQIGWLLFFTTLIFMSLRYLGLGA